MLQWQTLQVILLGTQSRRQPKIPTYAPRSLHTPQTHLCSWPPGCMDCCIYSLWHKNKERKKELCNLILLRRTNTSRAGRATRVLQPRWRLGVGTESWLLPEDTHSLCSNKPGRGSSALLCPAGFLLQWECHHHSWYKTLTLLLFSSQNSCNYCCNATEGANLLKPIKIIITPALSMPSCSRTSRSLVRTRWEGTERLLSSSPNHLSFSPTKWPLAKSSGAVK